MAETIKWKRKFYPIAIGQSVSLIGSSAVQFAMIWWLASETKSAMILSLAGLCTYLPQIVLGPFAGVWVDRLKRKNVIIGADLFNGIVALLFAFVFFSGFPPYWTACVVIGIRAIGGVFHMPAIQSTIPTLVPPENLVRANSVNQFLQTGAFMLGPVLGAAMYSVFPMAYILMSDFIGAIIAILTILFIKLPVIKQTVNEKRHIFNELKEGIKLYLQDKKLFLVTLIIIICLVFLMPLATFFPLVITNVFNGTEWHTIIIQMVYSAGLLIGAVIIGALGTKIKNKLSISIFGIFIFAFTALLCGIVPGNTIGFWLLTAICLFMGIGLNVYSIPYITYLQENIPNEAQGRIFSLNETLTTMTMPVGLIIAGPIAEIFSVQIFFIFSGVVSIITIIVYKIISMKYGWYST